MRRLLVVVVLAACGRVAFGPRTDASLVGSADSADSGDPVDPSLIAHYKLDDAPADGVLDSSGRGNDGTCLTTCPVTAAGRFDGAYELNGTTDGLTLPDLRPGALTVSAWVFRTGAVSQNIASKPFGPGDQNSWQLVIAADSALVICMTQQDFSGLCDGSGPGTVGPFVWEHVAYVTTGAEHRGYLNGVAFGPQALGLGYDNHLIYVGVDVDSGTNVSYLQGRIDELRIYDRALSATEIQQLALGLEP